MKRGHKGWSLEGDTLHLFQGSTPPPSLPDPRKKMSQTELQMLATAKEQLLIYSFICSGSLVKTPELFHLETFLKFIELSRVSLQNSECQVPHRPGVLLVWLPGVGSRFGDSHRETAQTFYLSFGIALISECPA